jgi:hypothetical protein
LKSIEYQIETSSDYRSILIAAFNVIEELTGREGWAETQAEAIGSVGDDLYKAWYEVMYGAAASMKMREEARSSFIEKQIKRISADKKAIRDYDKALDDALMALNAMNLQASVEKMQDKITATEEDAKTVEEMTEATDKG